MTTTHGLSTENLSNDTGFVDRLISIVGKMNDLERQMRMMPQNADLLPRWQAMVANELGRTRQFAWRLLKDVEIQARISAATKQPTDNHQ